MKRHLRQTLFAGTALFVSLLFASSLLGITGCGRQTTGLKDPTKTPGKDIPASKMLTQEDLLYADLPFGPDMSPVGKSVMWVAGNYSEGNELPGWRMFVADLTTLSATQVAEGELIPTVFPKWSPDGAAFAFVTPRPMGPTSCLPWQLKAGLPRS